jgi:glutamyl-tRNA synthetase
MAENIRVRLAPSPTGKFHIGTARTALFNYLFAKRYGGTFVLRIEDTDKERSNDIHTKDIIDGLLWLELGWDEGPEVGGHFGPYFQQERLSIYEQYINQLLDAKKAYRCFCTAQELTAEREAQQAKKEPPKYSGKCRHLTAQEIDAFERNGRTSVVRFIVEPQSVVVSDLIRGEVTFDSGLFGDFIISRSDGVPTFLFANVIDDRLMEISHVFRGEEHLANTAKQLLLAQALNFLSPQFGHFPLIFNPDRSKMSKRKDPVSVTDDFKAKGYLPEALVNFIALLGWSSGTDREIYTMHELINDFQIERVGKSPSIFDLDKLNWMNGYYIRHSPVGRIASSARQFITDPELGALADADPARYLEVVGLVQDRMKRLDEVQELISFVYIAPKGYAKELLIAKKSTQERTLKAITLSIEALRALETVTLDEIEAALRQAAHANELTDGELLWAVRVALSGLAASPGTFELVEILGRDESIKRLQTAKRKLEAASKRSSRTEAAVGDKMESIADEAASAPAEKTATS